MTIVTFGKILLSFEHQAFSSHLYSPSESGNEYIIVEIPKSNKSKKFHNHLTFIYLMTNLFLISFAFCHLHILNLL